MARETLAFSRDNEAAARILLQHWIIRDQFGFLLDPSVPIDQKDLKLADLACGSGMWLLELAETTPSTWQLDGFDISPAHFPKKADVSENLSFAALDSLAPVPPHLRGVYDVVHSRGFMLYVPGGDPSGLLHNIMDMLKPGGYLQLEELDLMNMYVQGEPGKWPHCERYIKQGKRWLQSRHIDASWTSALDKAVRDQGLEVSKYHKYAFRPSLQYPWTVMQTMATKDFILNDIIPTCYQVENGLTEDEWMQTLHGFVEETQQGARVLMDISICVVKK
ncbi:methyltransferase domain-containing protein 2 [Elsinoe australis]|uniref:Methyltransferase domain-containing protein 2 n=1 Tax=Elsinoe australis TaxID=40998 RepID=A0A4U7BAT4_9PEZI|nr:methyltransferase domain-containing protein 2 [Elsinoe australis]